MERRDVLKMLAAGPLLLAAAEKDNPLYFTKAEFELLDSLTELIIPADQHSPGAHAAGVAAYIDRTVAEAFLPEEKQEWKTGLAGFAKAGKKRQAAILTKLSKDDDKFFLKLKNATAFAYYSSEIGIHKDIEYKGNVIQPNEFAGYDAV